MWLNSITIINRNTASPHLYLGKFNKKKVLVCLKQSVTYVFKSILWIRSTLTKIYAEKRLIYENSWQKSILCLE